MKSRQGHILTFSAEIKKKFVQIPAIILLHSENTTDE